MSTRRLLTALLAGAALLARSAFAAPDAVTAPGGFDIAPFALPHAPPGEYWFEEPRDVVGLEVRFRGPPPDSIAVRYQRRNWPQTRLETARPIEDPCGFGWMPIDDWFNGGWQTAAVDARRADSNRVLVVFRGLAAELPEQSGYDVPYRRTLALRLDVPDPGAIEQVRIVTTSPPATSRLRVELDAGRRTPGGIGAVSGHNARVTERTEGPGRTLALAVSHMRPAHPFCGDDGLVTFALEEDTFTVSLSALAQQGPVWYAEQGVYVALAEDTTSFAGYRGRTAGAKTLDQRVRERREQTYAGARNGQPRPHPASTNLGCPLHRHRFRLEANGDLVLHRWNVFSLPAPDTARFLADGDARLFFGLERRAVLARVPDPAPVLATTLTARDGDVVVEQRSFAAPLDAAAAGSGVIVALVRFRFENRGTTPAVAELPVAYAHRSGRSENAYAGEWQDDRLVPRSERDSVSVAGPLLVSRWHGRTVMRARWEGGMAPEGRGREVVFRRRLPPGGRCELLLKVPFVAPEEPRELASIAGLDFAGAERAMAATWRREAGRGAALWCPQPELASLHAAHVSHVLVTDALLPDGSGLVNTSVGTSTYGNFANEACMVVHELDQRGLHDEARRRLEVWIRYQGTARQPGNFTDFDGMYYGAGGFEHGDYNQHHGWVLWCLGEHYLLTGDTAWLARVAPSLVAGCDWVFRQRRNTMGDLPRSRGWEHGFLPAGSLEDVTDFHYWLSTNALTWRGVDTAAEALAAIGHPEAPRLRREADAYRADLVRGFETMRRGSPLVRLRDGRWVPHYPARLYRRGRDAGWIREVLEGPVHLLTTGLFDARAPQAGWILDDYQDNLYLEPPFGYPVVDFEANWFDRGGFSIQPNLLAGLMPYLDRDEPEAFLRMFFNAWCACYRDEIDAMVEHPNPALGYSSAAHFKTSDEGNAVSWLRAMFVHADRRVLHLGRALPREWLASDRPCGTRGVCTRWGTVDVEYRAAPGGRRITATLDLRLRSAPPAVLVRFRHPDGLPLRAVRVDGVASDRFDPGRNDVDVTGRSGRVTVEAEF